MPELARFEVGLLHVFLQHTSASVTINENADPDVPDDLESSFSHIVSEHFPYRHTIEGPDDMPSHVRSVLTQTSLGIPVARGRCDLGTWQGIYLWEHRHAGHRRRLTVTVIGA